MVRNILLALAMSVNITGAALAAAPDPDVITRSGKWVANFDKDSCQLLAQFGEGDDIVVARFTRYQLGDSFDLALYGKRLRTGGNIGEAKIDFGLGGPPARERVMMGKSGELPAVFLSGVRLDGWESKARGDVAPKITPQDETAVSGVTVAVTGKRPFRLAFGSLSKPMEMMRTCMNTLIKSWGYDPDVQANLSRPATPVKSPVSWIPVSDYPSAAISNGHSGIVQFRLDVDAKGDIAACDILFKTEPDDFATRTCSSVSRRAKLMPALDARGNPVRSFFISKVHWIIAHR